MDEFTNLENTTKWVIEGIKNGSIIIKSNHEDTITKRYKNKDFYALHNELIMLFMLGFMIENEKDNFNSLKSGKNFVFGHSGECSECGERIFYTFNGKEIIAVNSERETLNCIKAEKELEFEINFPTGELLCGDSIPYMREIMKRLNLDDQAHTLCSTKGLHEKTINYASVNMFHICVGNTSPSLWLNNGVLAVGNSVEEFECDLPDECCETELEILPLGQNSKKIGSICTDLWWATIVDKEIYKSLLVNHYGEKEGIEKFNDILTIKDISVSEKIILGTYKCTYYSEMIDNEDYNEPIIYCKLEINK